MAKNSINLSLVLILMMIMFETAFSQDKKIVFPYLIQCENATDKNDCSRRMLYNYILQQTISPKVLVENEIEGFIVLQFTITSTGKITDVSLIKNIGGGAGKEGIQLLEKMTANGLKWQFGTINGLPKDFIVPRYPIYFDKKANIAHVPPHFNMIAKEKVRTIKMKKRQKKTTESKKKLVPSISKSNPPQKPLKENKKNKENLTIYSEVDQNPIFPGCQDGGPFRDPLKANDCSLMALNNYVAKSLKYPSQAFSGGIEGVVVIQYVVEKDGQLSNIKCIKDIGNGCGAAAIELFEQMNTYNIRWKPALIQQKKVRVQKRYIVRFDLAQEKARRSQRNN